MKYTTKQRRDLILRQVLDKTYVKVNELSEEIGVSEATIRRDLKNLAQDNQIKLVYGGAEHLRVSDYSFRAKSRRNLDSKKTIGKLAAELIKDDDQVFIDSGTTCFEMAHFLRQKRGLTIIVNSSRLVLELPESNGINIITLGGRYRPDRMDTVGPLATATLDQLRGYTAIVGADGLSMDFGLTASDMESAFLYRQAVRNASATWLLVDHTKFLTPSLFKIVGWDALSRVITDAPPPSEWAEFLRGRNIEVVYPSEQAHAVSPDANEAPAQ
ncbi:MAG: DeoR/GlpR transcriptional regulator [Planctomycetes bacterium]|jgi:DeoR family transcriptional regulator of aga operon|nr:DeoR/GlpR transcriptional regulator [Planctomycetota bacterium]